jgi:hypothetical protein
VRDCDDLDLSVQDSEEDQVGEPLQSGTPVGAADSPNRKRSWPRFDALERGVDLDDELDAEARLPRLVPTCRSSRLGFGSWQNPELGHAPSRARIRSLTERQSLPLSPRSSAT